MRSEFYFVEDDGSIKTKNLTTPRRRHIAMIFRYYAEAFHSTYRLDRTGPGWVSLTSAFTIRDRITHPDTADQLEITDGETRSIEEAFCFFWNSLAKILDEGIGAAKRRKSYPVKSGA